MVFISFTGSHCYVKINFQNLIATMVDLGKSGMNKYKNMDCFFSLIIFLK